jgi:hypothetical protein
MPLSPQQKKNAGSLAKLSGAAALVGGFVHIGQYAALGFLDTKLSQALRAGKEFVPDGFHALTGTIASAWDAWYRNPTIATLMLAVGAALIVLLRLRPSRTLFITMFAGVAVIVALLVAPAFQVINLLNNPPDPSDVPNTRVAQWILRPVVDAMIFSRVPPPSAHGWDPLQHRAALSARFSMLAFATLVLWLMSLIVPESSAALKQWTGWIALAAIVITAYYYGAVQADTRYHPALALTGHAQLHDRHAAFVLGNVGDTYSIFSFDYGNEDVEKRYLDIDPERADDVLEFRLNRPSLNVGIR